MTDTMNFNYDHNHRSDADERSRSPRQDRRAQAPKPPAPVAMDEGSGRVVKEVDFARFAGALLRHTVGNPKEQLKAELVAAFDDGLSHSIIGASHQTSSTPSGPA